MKRVWFARKYDVTRGVLFSNYAGWRVFGTVLAVGPLVFAIMWRRKDRPA